MKRKSPQLKKAESYRKDRRNTYGENAKASRKAVPRKKRSQARAERRLARKAFPAGSRAPDADQFDEVEARLLEKRRSRGNLKAPDTPLGEVVARKLERRSELGMISAKEAADRARKARKAGKFKGQF